MSIESKYKRELEHFNKLASEENLAWWGATTPAAKLRLERRVEIFKSVIKNENFTSPIKVLEIGCADGAFTEALANDLPENLTLYSMDLSPKQIELAKGKIKNENVKLLVGNASETGFESDSFDLVIGNSILHHLDLQSALLEIKRILKPGRKLLFFEPNMVNPQIMVSLSNPFCRKLYQASPDETAFIRWDLRKKIIESGFKNVNVEPFDFMHPYVPKSLFSSVKSLEKVLEKTPVKEIAGSLTITAEK